jgi:hypothetical protein
MWMMMQTVLELEITAADGTIIPLQSIPDCSGNTTNPARIKRHLVKCP